MITRSNGMPVPLKLALRELRGGLAGFRVFALCLILGVAAIAAVGSLTRAIEDSLAREGQALLGGDISIRQFQRAVNEDLVARVEGFGTISRSARLRTMARAKETGRATLVELRAVDHLYPLYGELETSPQLDNESLFAPRDGVYGLAVDEALAERLDVGVGDRLVFGTIDADVRAVILREPDKANQGFQLGPSVLIRLEALQQSGLVTTGSLVNNYLKVRLGPDVTLKQVRDAVEELEDDTTTWRVRDRTNAAQGLRRFIDQMGSFLVIVGLASLVVGGVGVGNAVKGYMDRKTRTIATLKILGASGRTIFQTYFFQVMLIGFLSTAIGLSLGAFLPGFLAQFLPDSVPVKISLSVYPDALLIAGIYGTLITVAFTAWPLGRARDLPAVRLFRAIVAPESGRPRLSYMMLILVAVIAVVGLAIGLASNVILASSFMGGAVAALLLLRFTSWLIEKGAARLPRPKNALMRMALANLHRPGSATGAVVISLGLGLTLFASLALIEGNLSGRLGEQIPSEAPAFFLVDVQPDQKQPLIDALDPIEGVSELTLVPNIRGKIVRLNETPAKDWTAPDPSFNWILNGDRGISFSESGPPSGSELVDGDWWPDDYTGAPQISFGRVEAEGLGIAIGDTLTINVLGREITAEIVSLREINWEGFSSNFVLVFDPNTLKAAPHTYLATLKASGEAEREAYRTIIRGFPNVTAVRIKDVLTSVNDLLGQVSSAVTSTAVVAIIAGVLVLAGAIAAGFRQRVYESVILKVVGAVRRQVLTAYLAEYLMIGLITASIALGLGSIAGYLVVQEVMEIEFRFLPVPMAIVVFVSLGVTILFGLGTSWRALSVKPNSVLRQE